MDFPLLAACYSGSHHWPVFSLQGVQCWGNGKVCNKSKSKYSFYSDMCECPMDTVHGTYHSAMTASNLCHMWRFILIYEKSLFVIFSPCLSVTLILFFDDLKFSYILVQGSDRCDRLRARRLYLPRKGTCGEEGRVQQQPCPEYPLLVQLCVDMEKTWILSPTTFRNHV